MEELSKNKNSKINCIDNGYSQISFLAQLELIKTKRSVHLEAIAKLEYYKIKYKLKQCRIILSRIDETNSTTKIIKRKIKVKQDQDFWYY